MPKDTSLGVLVPLDKIKIVRELQGRCRIHDDKVKEYAALYKDGIEMDPIHLFVNVEEEYLLADGNHRVLAAAEAELKKISAIIHDDDRENAFRNALWFNIDRTAGAGLSASPEDKRRMVALALKQDRRSSDRAIARLCRVSSALVKKIRDKGFTANEPRKKVKEKPGPVATRPQEVEPVNGAPEPERPTTEPVTHAEVITDRQKTLNDWVKREEIGIPEIRDALSTPTTTIAVVPKEPVHMMVVFEGGPVKVPISGFKVKSGVIEIAADRKAFLDALNWELAAV